MNLSSKQRAYLSSLASTINPIFNIGKASLTPEIIEALDAALEKRELIKVAVLKNCIDDPRGYKKGGRSQAQSGNKRKYAGRCTNY